MATWSCKFIYSSDEDDNTCIKSTQSSENDSSSISRPLQYTITMSSGSSGADTFSSMSECDSLSCSEPSTRAGTPPETPAAAGIGGRGLLSLPLFMLSRARFISLTSSRQDLGYDAETESSFSRHLVDSGGSSPLHGPTGEEGALDYSMDMGKQIDILCGSTVDKDAWRSSRTGSEERSGEDEEDGIDTRIPPPMLQRSRRPPPLDLSAISCSRIPTPERQVPTSPINHDSPSTPVKRPYTAPLVQMVDPDMAVNLPQMPATAPFLTMPKAPVIRPTMPAFDRTPSPLMLPSPCIPWSLDESHPSSASTTSIFWGLSPLPPQAVSHRRRHTVQPRRVSLGQKIAKLRETSARAPIPPSLQNSPILTHLTSPRIMPEISPDSPTVSSIQNDIILSPPAHYFVGTPVRVHRNPYFSREEGISATNDVVGIPELNDSWPGRLPVHEGTWARAMPWMDED